MSNLEFPPSVAINKDAKIQIRDGVRAAIDLLKGAEAIEANAEYDAVLNDPPQLYKFIRALKDNHELFGQLLVDAQGTHVTDQETVLSWGVNLGQVERLLVLTCAKRFFAAKVIKSKVKVKKQVRQFLFLKKTVETTKVVKRNELAKFERIKEYLGYDWQLPLLKIYRDDLPTPHIVEVGHEILSVTNKESLKKILAYDPSTIKNVANITEDDFLRVANQKPEAFRGISVWDQDRYFIFLRLFKEKAWDFFARDNEFFNAAAGLDDTRLKIFGDLLVTISTPCLMEMERLNLDRLEGTLVAFRDVFGQKVYDVFAMDDKFAYGQLHKIVEAFMHMKVADEDFVETAKVTMKSHAEEILAKIA